MLEKIKIERNQDWVRSSDKNACRIFGVAHSYVEPVKNSTSEIILFQFEKIGDSYKTYALSRDEFLKQFTYNPYVLPEKNPVLWDQLRSLLISSSGNTIQWANSMYDVIEELSKRNQFEDTDLWRQAGIQCGKFLATVSPTNGAYKLIVSAFARSGCMLDGQETYKAVKDIVLNTINEDEMLMQGLFGHHGILTVLVNRISGSLRNELRNTLFPYIKRGTLRYQFYESLLDSYIW